MPKFTICAAFYMADERATVTVEADDIAGACREAIRMVDHGEVTTHTATWDPTPTWVYGVVEGEDRDPFAGMHLVPDEFDMGNTLHPAAHAAFKREPELLAVVKECLEAEMRRRENLRPGAPASTYCEARITRIRAVLAKAEGRADG